jgi:hypothetical protein
MAGREGWCWYHKDINIYPGWMKAGSCGRMLLYVTWQVRMTRWWKVGFWMNEGWFSKYLRYLNECDQPSSLKAMHGNVKVSFFLKKKHYIGRHIEQEGKITHIWHPAAGTSETTAAGSNDDGEEIMQPIPIPRMIIMYQQFSSHVALFSTHAALCWPT